MALVGIPTDSPTEQLDRVDDGTPSNDLHAWWKRLSLLAWCLVVTALLSGALAMLGVARHADPQDIDVGWLVAAGAGLFLAMQATFIAGLRDFVDRRLAGAERRDKALIQCETYRLEQGQASIREGMTEVRTQLALQRAEMVALLGRLPDGVVEYGDVRDEEGEERAVRRIAAASGHNVPTYGIASVTRLRPVDHSN